jgi:serine/threonine-protein kinase
VKLCPTCGSEYGDEQKFCPKDGSALRSSQSGDLVGSVVAERYHILKKLGEGGMGAVYLGEHVKMGRKSAIKVMTSSMAHDPEAIARFNREASNASRINHPNVCAIYDFGETPDGVIYLAMEFIEGGSLGDVLDREGTLPPQRAAAILRQTADALQAAHDLGIVHRDLKPDNIMLARGRDGADMVKVVDFGIAKAMTGEEGQQVTKTGLVVGTPEYMSPEQLSGDKLDGRSDIYSLALVFYRMVTGTFPFQAETAQEMMIKRLTDDPLPLATTRPDLMAPPALEIAIRRALGRMPSERYVSAVEFAKDVARAVEGLDAAGPVTEGATQIINGADAAGRLAPTRVGAATPATPTTPQPKAAVPSPPRKKAPVLAIAAAVVVLGGGGAAAAMLLGGGSGTPPTGDTTTAVAPDTQQAAGSTGTPTQRRDTARRTRPDSTPGQPGGGTPPAVDLAAVNANIIAVGRNVGEDGADAAARQRAMRELDGHYANGALPDSLRAKAASYVAEYYEFARVTDQACLWIGRAVQLDPTKRGYASYRQALGCTS